VRNMLSTIFLVAIGLLTLSVPVFAHHGNASYDNDKTVTVKGTVTQYVWANPHVLLKVDAKDDSGQVQHWVIEGENPAHVANLGWTRTTFKPGDEVLVDVRPVKNGLPVGRFKSRIVINGQVFRE
jgi:hypothetical protein